MMNNEKNSTEQGFAVRMTDVDFGWTQKRARPKTVAAQTSNYQVQNPNEGFRFQIPSFEVKKGERLILVGPSGSGKSTLLGLICGTLVPQAGRVEVLGEDLTQLRSAARDKFRGQHVGIIFQQLNLVPYLSVIENVLLPLQFSPARMKAVGKNAAACRSSAADILDALDMPVEQFGSQKAGTLSIGQQQRVAAARAFIGSPEIIIADEPTSALDRSRQVSFLEHLFEQQRQTDATLLMVSHDETIAEHFDRVVQLGDICDMAGSEGNDLSLKHNNSEAG